MAKVINSIAKKRIKIQEILTNGNTYECTCFNNNHKLTVSKNYITVRINAMNKILLNGDVNSHASAASVILIRNGMSENNNELFIETGVYAKFMQKRDSYTREIIHNPAYTA